MKFYGQFNPPVDQIIFERYRSILDQGSGYFIESGAFDGVTESNCKFLEESLGWTGVNVEPFPHHYRKLLVNRPRSLNLNCALSSVNGSHTFTHVIHPRLGDNFGNGSLSHTNQHREQLDENGCHFQELDVTTLTYDTLVAATQFPRIDLLSLDVEGHESEVLKGMNRHEWMPRLLCIETGHDADHQLHQQLADKGYVKDSDYLVNSFYLKAA